MSTVLQQRPLEERGYAHQMHWFTTDWVAEHLDDPRVRLVESHEDGLLYETGHIPWRCEARLGEGSERSIDPRLASGIALSVQPVSRLKRARVRSRDLRGDLNLTRWQSSVSAAMQSSA